MDLMDIIQRQPSPEPWAEGEKIPWDEPGFSKRMLREHLNQEHDAASRRFEIIDRHVDWIHQHCLSGQPSRILDLGCGPGLYTNRLARLGHTCEGIDFSPASIFYAREQAKLGAHPCRYTLADMRQADYGRPYGLVMLINGEFNVFRQSEVLDILEKAHTALSKGGSLLLEPHTFEAVKRSGVSPPHWYSSPRGHGLFSEGAHLCLTEKFWREEESVAIVRHYIIEANNMEVQRHSATIQAYKGADYRQLLESCGFKDVTFYPGLTGDSEMADPNYCAITAHKRGSG